MRTANIPRFVSFMSPDPDRFNQNREIFVNTASISAISSSVDGTNDRRTCLLMVDGTSIPIFGTPREALQRLCDDGFVECSVPLAPAIM